MSQIPINPFLAPVQRAAILPRGPHQNVLVVLQELCDAVAQYPGGRLQCSKVPGFVTNLGQEYRIVVKPTTKPFEHLLLRAHIPASGTPIMLDLYDDDLFRCDSPAVLEQQLTSFLERDSTQDVLRTLAA